MQDSGWVVAENPCNGADSRRIEPVITDSLALIIIFLFIELKVVFSEVP